MNMHERSKTYYMKKPYRSLLLFFAALFFAPLLRAQQPITIDSASVQGYYYTGCTLPVTFNVYLTASRSVAYLPNDSFTVYVDYGDGQQVQQRLQTNFYNMTGPAGIAWNNNHAYTTQGIYSVTLAVADDYGATDTLHYNNAVSISSGCNVTGRVYVDRNQNCVFDGTDTPVQYANMQLWPTGAPQFPQQVATNASGQYSFNAIIGNSYNITSSGVNFNGPSWFSMFTCGAQDSTQFTAAASTTFDIPLQDTRQINITTAGDSTHSYCNVPALSYQMVGMTGYNYSPGDSVHVHAFFGDGQDTVVSGVMTNYVTPFTWAYLGLPHTYTQIGNYVPMYIITDNYGYTDTVFATSPIFVDDSCGTITGYVYIDADANCSYTTGEAITWNTPVYLFQGSQFVQADYVNQNGMYSFNVTAGNYTVLVYPNWYTPYQMTCNSPSSVNLTVAANGSVTHDFGFICPANAINDASAFLSGWGFRPGGQGGAHLYPGIYSQSCNQMSGTVTLLLDPLTSFVGSCDTSFNPQVNGNMLTWNFNATSPFYNMWPGCLILQTDSSAQLGDTVCFTMIITPSSPDANQSNDTITVCYPVRNSWDPNMKEATPEGNGPNHEIPQSTTLTYTVHFQNTGTDVAYNIAITDTIDSNLDITTMQILGSSHAMEADITGANIMRFSFANINLPDSASDEPHSHGWVTYRITALPNQLSGTQITNTAYIYFDINPAVITNTTLHTILDPSGISEAVEVHPVVYPSPANDQVKVEFSSRFTGTAEVYDMVGQRVVAMPVDSKNISIPVTQLPAGMYLLRCTGNKQQCTATFVVQH